MGARQKCVQVWGAGWGGGGFPEKTMNICYFRDLKCSFFKLRAAVNNLKDFKKLIICVLLKLKNEKRYEWGGREGDSEEKARGQARPGRSQARIQQECKVKGRGDTRSTAV